jgi:hypothetical protein
MIFLQSNDLTISLVMDLMITFLPYGTMMLLIFLCKLSESDQVYILRRINLSDICVNDTFLTQRVDEVLPFTWIKHLKFQFLLN